MEEKRPHSTDQERFQHLTDLLFEEDRQVSDRIIRELDELRVSVDNPEEIQARIAPFLDQKVTFLRENFPELFGPVMAETIKQQIRDSQDEMIDALYPIIGKLIRKFVSKELERLFESIDQSINDTFSWQGWKRRIRGWFTGESDRDRIMKSMVRTEIREVFIIDQLSGLMAGGWSSKHLTDRDMVAGMLTAIKSFTESAFDRGEQNLEMIEYESYRIILENFKTYYVAVVVEGAVTPQFRQRLSDFLLALTERHRIYTRDDLNEETITENSKILEESFHEFHPENN